MKAVSSKWLRTVTGSFVPYYRVTIVSDFQTGSSPVGVRVPHLDGEVVLDGNADVYATGKLTIPGSYWPDPHGDTTLAPFGPEAFVQAGIRYRDDLVELVPLGYFRLRTLDQREATTTGPINVTMQDRMYPIVRAKLLAPVLFTADTTNGEFFEALVTEVYPEAQIEWDDDAVRDAPLGRDVLVESDRYGALSSVATGNGKVMRFNELGVLVLFTPPNPLDSDPVAVLRTHQRGVLAEAARSLTDEDVANVVVARGDGADEVGAAYGAAYDLDPLSPTRFGGPFGPAPIFVTSSAITSNDLAILAAQAELTRHVGLPHVVTFEISPRFELEPHDLVLIHHPNAMARHLISTVKIPLIAGETMEGSTRQTRLTFQGA